jgi:hypothetical protein
MLNTEKYQWADEDYDLALTVAVIDGCPEDEVVRAYGGDPSRPVGGMTFAETFTLVPDEDFGDYFFVQTLNVGRFVVALENNGWAGTSTAVARHVSQDGGSFFSVHWDAVTNRIVEARNGKLTADFDPLLAQGPTGPGGVYPAWLEEVVFTPEGLRSSMLMAMELRTRLGFEREWFDLKLGVWRVSGSRKGT